MGWGIEEVELIYKRPFLALIADAVALHRQHHSYEEMQRASLISIKTGGCPEDCAYCPQSAHYVTGVKSGSLMKKEAVVEEAKRLIAEGAQRICLGAAWRQARDSAQFEQVLEMVKEIRALGVEVCTTLGMVNCEQAHKLKRAGLTAYNHNLDTSRAFYKKIISTRSYDERLATLDAVEEAGLEVCCGGILGLGESIEDRLQLLLALANRTKQPASLPINKLIPIPGTPLEHNKPCSIWDFIRFIATARILMPKTVLRIAAGREEMSYEEQALCFLAGVNSIFLGDRLLTEKNATYDRDQVMFKLFGVRPLR